MSYDLSFWKEPASFGTPPQEVYDLLCDGQAVDGLDAVSVEEMKQRIAAAFSDWERLDETTWESAGGWLFQVSSTPQSHRVDCHGLDGEDMNKFIDIANAFGCPLYDPQVGQRYSAG